MSRWILPSSCKYCSPIRSSRQTIAICASVNVPGLSYLVSSWTRTIREKLYQIKTTASGQVLHDDPQSPSPDEAPIIPRHMLRVARRQVGDFRLDLGDVVVCRFQICTISIALLSSPSSLRQDYLTYLSFLWRPPVPSHCVCYRQLDLIHVERSSRFPHCAKRTRSQLLQECIRDRRVGQVA